MFENEWFPKANAMGVSWQEFWQMNPRIIKLLAKGHEEKIKEQDMLNWQLGMYVASALDSTVCNSGFWRKRGSKPHSYVEKPFLSAEQEKTKEESGVILTEEDKKKQTEQLFMKLRIMGANFNLNHKN